MVDALIPGSEVVNGKQALQRMLPDATWLHGAVAFATQTGVDELTSVLEEVGAPETLRIVVRGAPITEPQAVLALDRDLEADVRVVMGAGAHRFHPKLWVARTPRETWVLSGSGNLTAGGLVANDEQFELLHLPQQRMGSSGATSGSNKPATAQLARWQRFWDKGIPLLEAVGSPAWELWEQQLARRAELRDELDELDQALREAAPQRPGSQPPGRGGDDRMLSALTQRPTIERWMRRWYPEDTVREEVWNVLTDAIEAAYEHRPNGWCACAVHLSNHDGLPRLAVYCGSAQVLVVHSRRGVFFETPAEHRDPAGYAAGQAALATPGAVDQPWGDGDNRHPVVIVPGDRAREAADAGGRDAVAATINWRSPKVEHGNAAHRQFHCAALVDAARRATGRSLHQPGYSTSA